MEWIMTVIAKHTKEDGTVDQEAINAEMKTEFAKNAVPKSDFNAKTEELKKANETLENLQKDNGNVEELQSAIAEYKTQVADLQTEQASRDKQYKIETALRDAKASDIEYLAFKLGDTETDKDGNIINLDSKIKDLQADYPTFFQEVSSDKDDNPSPPGYKPVGNDLKDGEPAETDLTEQMVAALTSDLPEAITK